MTTFVVSDSGGWVALGSSGLPSSGVTPGTYGDSTHVAQVTVNAAGQVTAASSVAIPGVSLQVTDGSTTVTNVTDISFSGATVSSGGAGIADVAVAGGGGGMTLLSDTVLGANTASIDISGLSQAYKHLIVYIVARSTRAFTVDTLGVQFNGDTGSNYSFETAVALNGSAVSGGETLGTTSLGPGAPGDTATANCFCGMIFDIPDYTSTAHIKAGTWRDAYPKALTSGNIILDQGGWFWNSTAAITEIKLFAQNGNLKTGTRLTIYGTP